MYDRCRSGVIGVDHERIDFYRRREKKRILSHDH